MKVKEIGLKEVICVQANTNLAEIAAQMKRHNIGVVPVCESDRLIGIITDRDLVISCMASGVVPESCQAREFMTAHPVSVTPDTDPEEAAHIMGKEQLHRVPVVQGEKLAGMISLADLAMFLHNDALLGETVRRISAPAPAMAGASH